MTTIAFDGKILAADTKLTSSSSQGSWYKVGTISKIRIINGKAVAACGDTRDTEKFEDWLISGADPGQYPKKLGADFNALVLGADGLFEYMHNSPGKGLRLRHFPKVMGTEAGEHYAQALMSLGMNAHDAIEKTASYCCHTGLPVYSITQEMLEELEPTEIVLWEGTYKDDISAHRAKKKRKKSDSQRAEEAAPAVPTDSVRRCDEKAPGG